MRWYIDSSAIIKLINLEPESKALVASLPQKLTTSQLARIEVIRTINTHFPELLEDSYSVLTDIPMIPIDDAVITVAQSLPAFITLRTLDSIHLASALTIKNEIEGIISYDKEINKAAVAVGFKVSSPGMK